MASWDVPLDISCDADEADDGVDLVDVDELPWLTWDWDAVDLVLYIILSAWFQALPTKLELCQVTCLVQILPSLNSPASSHDLSQVEGRTLGGDLSDDLVEASGVDGDTVVVTCELA